MRYGQVYEPTVWQRISARAYALIFVREPDFIEFLMGALILAWGCQLAAPWTTFAPASVTFSVLAAIPPYTERGWGVLFIALGVLKLAGYFLDYMPLRLVASLFVSSAWAFVAGAFGYANPTGTGVIAYAGISLASSWVFWRLILQARGGP